ncbi:hypothetical protein HGG75_24905 [Ochrobactrum pseudogrignonense]|nr:hypothetical protein [Brucella pseudogrignonensis]
MTLGGVTSYTGATAINGGILRTGVANALTQSTGIALNGGTFDLSGYNQTVGALNGGTGASVTLGSAMLTVDTATNNSFWGSISGGGGLTKAGSGLLICVLRTAIQAQPL